MSFHRIKSSIIGASVFLSILLAVSPAFGQSEHVESYREAVQRVTDEGFNQGNIDVIDAIFSSDAVIHNADGSLASVEDFKHFIATIRAAIPDLEATLNPLITSDAYAGFRFVMTGTFENAFVMPDGTVIPPTGMPFSFAQNIIVRFDEDGQIVEEWDAGDNLSLLSQLGVIPMPEDAGSQIVDEPATDGDDTIAPGMEVAHRDVVLRVFDEIINQGNLDVAEEIFASDFTHREGGEMYDLEAWKMVVTTFRAAIPDLELQPDIVVAEGNYAAVFYTLRGTQTGEMPLPDGSILPPTGASLELPSIILIRFDDNGRIVDTWDEYDNMTLLGQLGLLSEPDA